MSDVIIMCRICGKHPVAYKDYRFIDSCGLQGKVLVCEFCFDLNDATIRKIVRDKLDPKDFYRLDDGNDD